MRKACRWDNFEYPKNLILALGMSSINADEITDLQLKGMLFCVDTLDPTQKYIIEAYFKQHMAFDWIAKELKTNTADLAKSANKALDVLRHPSRLKYIKDRRTILSEFTKAEIDLKYAEEQKKKKEKIDSLTEACTKRLGELEHTIDIIETGLDEIKKILGDKADDIERILHEIYKNKPVDSNENSPIGMIFPENIVNDILIYDVPKSLGKDHIRGLNYVLSRLDLREKEILLLRYKDGLSIRSIADRLELSGQRVEQIVKKALERCRHPKFKNYIRYGYYIGSGDAEKDIEKKYIELENAKKKQLEILDADVDYISKNMDIIKMVIGDKYELINQRIYSIHKRQAMNGYILITDLYNREELSTRAYNIIMRNLGPSARLSDIVNLRKDEVAKWRNAGDKLVGEIEGLLTKYGVAFKK